MKSKKNVVFLLSSVLLLSACGDDKPVVDGNTEEVKTGTVTVGTLSNGQITPSKTSGNVGEQITLTVSPSEGYEVDTVTANGEKLNATTDNKYVFNLKEGTNNVSATFKEINRVGKVIIYDSVNGSVTPDKTEGNVGDVITLTVTPSANYEVYKIKLNGEEIQAKDGVYSFELVEGANIVSALFNKIGGEVELRNSTIETTDGIANGTVTFNKTTGLLEGDVVEVTVKANDTYRIDWITFNGNIISVDNEGKANLVLKAGKNIVSAHFISINRRVIFSIEEKPTLSLRKTNIQTGFKDTKQTLKVGTENNFNFRPNIKVLEIEGEEFNDPFIDSNIEVNYKLSRFVEDKYVELPSTNEYVEKVNTVSCDIDFTDAAIGEKFKLTYSPKGLSEKQEANPKYHKEFTFEVMKGFNIYEAKELAYMNTIINTPAGGHGDVLDVKNGNDTIEKIGSNNVTNYYDAWREFRTDNGLDLDYIASNIILQDDIKITPDDLPSAFFVQKADGAPDFIGMLNDRNDLYRRAATKETGDFLFEGNYYTLDASEIPCIGLEENSTEGSNGRCQTSHTQLFRFTGDGKAKVEMRNIATFGNAPKLGDAVLAGGLIMNKVSEPTFTIRNNISKSWFITYFSTNNAVLAADQMKNPYNIIDSSAKDNYNTFVYSYGGYEVNVIDSDLIGAGGPCIITDRLLDRDDVKDNKFAVVPTLNVYGNSRLESLVEGKEGWFYAMGANAVVPIIKGFSTYAFNDLNYSFVKKSDTTDAQVMNFVWLNKCGSAQAMSNDPTIRGNFNRFTKVGDETPADSFNYFEDATDAKFKLTYGVQTSQKTIPPIFEMNTNKYFVFVPNLTIEDEKITGITGGDKMLNIEYYDIKPDQLPQIKPNFVEAYKKDLQDLKADKDADMTCLYYNGMALGFGLFPQQPAAK